MLGDLRVLGQKAVDIGVVFGGGRVVCAANLAKSRLWWWRPGLTAGHVGPDYAAPWMTSN